MKFTYCDLLYNPTKVALCFRTDKSTKMFYSPVSSPFIQRFLMYKGCSKATCFMRIPEAGKTVLAKINERVTVN